MNRRGFFKSLAGIAAAVAAAKVAGSPIVALLPVTTSRGRQMVWEEEWLDMDDEDTVFMLGLPVVDPATGRPMTYATFNKTSKNLCLDACIKVGDNLLAAYSVR